MIGCLTKSIFHLMGWKLIGRYPRELKHLILVVAPHTSNWDFPLGLLVKFWLKMDAVFYAKESLFRGPLGIFMRSIKGRPVNRSANNNTVSQVVADFRSNSRLHVLITPEGTRKRTDKFKSGFYHIAKEADVPLLPIIFDYGAKQIRMIEPFKVKGDGPAEIEEIRNIFKGIRGKNPEDGIF